MAETDPFGETPQEEANEQAAVDPQDMSTWGGDGYPNAPEEVQNAFRDLVFQAEQENALARLGQVKEILRNREFAAGRQISYWSETSNCYVVPTAQQLGVTQEEYSQAVELITNIITEKILIVMAELSQSPPRSAFQPEHAKNPADVKLAKDATNITQYLNRSNRVDERLAYEIWLLCTDASYAEYWRFVRDPKFGIEDYQVQEGENEVELAPNRAVCAECGYQEPVESPEVAPPVCETCGAPMGPQSFTPRETVMQPNIVTKQRPAGRLVMDVVGMLELVVPAYEKDEEELGFLTWCREVHKSKLMTIFPEAADKIKSGGYGGESPNSSYERIARLTLLSGYRQVTDGMSNLTTFRESWFRPWMYESLHTKMPEMCENFKKWFPEGFRVAFAGDVYCGSWSEALQDHWTICHDLPGDGQYRHPLASDSVAVQRKYNKTDNIQIETFLSGMSFYVGDTDVLSADAFKKNTETNQIIPAQGKGNKTVATSIWQSSPSQVSNQLIEYQNNASRIMDGQFGTYAPMYGGDTGGNDTAHGIAIERNAAKGRLGLVFRAIKNFRARCDLKNIRLFIKNYTQDVEIAVEGPGSEFDSVNIALADIREGNVQVKIEEDESFPVSLNEQKATVSALFNNQNPVVLGWFNEIGNAVELVDLLGVGERIRVPGADAREKCFDIIDILLKSGPLPPPPMPPQIDPMTGQPIPLPPMPPEPSIQPDPVLDNLPVYAQTCQEWAAGAAGRKAMLETPQGYDNVKAFAAKCQMLMAPPPLPPPPEGSKPKNKALPAPPESNPTGPMPEMGIQ